MTVLQRTSPAADAATARKFLAFYAAIVMGAVPDVVLILLMRRRLSRRAG